MPKKPVVRPRVVRSSTVHLAARPRAQVQIGPAAQAEETVVVLATTLRDRILAYRPDVRKDGEKVDKAKDVIELFKQTKTLYQEFAFTAAYGKTIGGVEYVILKGYPGLRKIFTAAKYSEQNSKIISYWIGKTAVRKAIVDGGVWSLVFVDSLDIAEYVIDRKETGADLGTNLVTDSANAVISTVAGVAAGVGLAMLGAPVVVPLAAGFVISLIVSAGLDWAEEHWKVKQAIHGWVQATVDESRRLAQYGRKQARLVGAKMDSAVHDGVQWLSQQWQDVPEWDDWIQDFAI